MFEGDEVAGDQSYRSESNVKPSESVVSQHDAVDKLTKTTQNPKRGLTPIDPSKAVKIYIEDRKIDLRSASLNSHKSALRFFVEYCEKEGIHSLANLSGHDLHKFKIWRSTEATDTDGSLAPATIRNQLNILKQFLLKCEEIEAVPLDFHEKVPEIDSSATPDSRDEILEKDRAESILEYFDKFQYAGLPHVVFKLLTATGMRIGTLRALDVEDVDLEGDFPAIEVKNRPETGTVLKNGDRGERIISLDASTNSVLADYLTSKRPEVSDSFGRNPLVTTGEGRIATSTIRRIVYKWTCPCQIDNDCPIGRNIRNCEAASHDSHSKCPVSKSPHAIRRGYITHELRIGLTNPVVSERCDVSEEVIDKHYDKRSEQERTRVRRDVLSEVHQSASPYGGD